MKTRSIYLFSAISGFVLVAFGAFGAHVLSQKLGLKEMEWIHTGLQYHAWHTLAMLGMAAASTAYAQPAYQKSALFFALGILLFSGSLYGLALTHAKFLVFITPIGGLCFLIGWLFMLIGALRQKQKADSHE